jgi:hypothetical protein
MRPAGKGGTSFKSVLRKRQRSPLCDRELVAQALAQRAGQLFIDSHRRSSAHSAQLPQIQAMGQLERMKGVRKREPADVLLAGEEQPTRKDVKRRNRVVFLLQGPWRSAAKPGERL